jgi:hypothetical protein
MTRYINAESLEHRSENGTIFKSDTCDLSSGVYVSKPDKISETNFASDIAEFAAWHSTCIFEQLNGFQPWKTVRYIITTH